MLSKAQVSHIKALRINKFREEYGEFTAEGPKLVDDLLHSRFEVLEILAVAEWLEKNRGLATLRPIKTTEVTPSELGRISALSTPNMVLARVRIPTFNLDDQAIHTSLVLALEDIRDPGNLGTILRIADWFGISTIICSPDCVDVFNPKTVQATMGSVARVQVFSRPLEDFLAGLPPGIPVYGTLLDGKPLHESRLGPNGVIVVGNESRGISPAVRKLITEKLLIPGFAQGRDASDRPDSLNASVATAIVCYEFRRRQAPGEILQQGRSFIEKF